MAIFISAALFLALGYALTDRFHSSAPLERACLAISTGLALWIASLWILALTHSFSRTGLIIRSIAVLIAAAALWRRRRFDGNVPALWLGFLPVALWLAFVLWRGAVVPPLTHDALAYHLPKATLLVVEGAYTGFRDLGPEIRWLPLNYELLVAESMAWHRSDRYTEWVALIFYGFLIVAAGALQERWWGRSRAAAVVVMLCVAATPVALLHSGADKNDLMVSALVVAVMVAIGRWITTGEESALMMGIVTAAAAIGTKPQAGFVALFFVPLIVWRLRREPRVLLRVVVVSICAFLLLGGAVYITNWMHDGSPFGAKLDDARSIGIVPFGVWKTLWQGPYVLVAAPFSRSASSLWVPWEGQPWFWRRYEIYFSHLGLLFSLAVAALPFALVARRVRSEGNARERMIVTLVAVAAFMSLLPVHFRPHGLYAISLPRYVLFLVPVVFGWTVAPLVRRIQLRSGRAATALVLVASVFFATQAWQYGRNDAFVPLKYLAYAIEHPGTRVVAFDPNRAASIADRAAGPRDRIAIDAGFGTWIQPAFGKDLQRPVEFIPPAPGPPQIGPDVKWVAVDRMFRTIWGHPDFTDLSQIRRYVGRGVPSADELRVIESLRRDPRFEVVFYNPKTIQALFRRVR